MKKRKNESAPLMDFIRAIIANDLPKFGKSLANNVALARQPLPTGAGVIGRKLLLRAGANPNDRDGRGKSGFESATGKGQSFIQRMSENA